MNATPDTSVTERHRDIVTAMYEAARKGDFDGFFAPLAPDIVVREPGFLPYGGAYHGHDGLRELFVKVGAILDVTGLDVHEIMADGDLVIGFIEAPVVGTSETVFLAERSRFRDGLVVEMQIFFFDAGPLLS